jgi:hypothetical protein
MGYLSREEVVVIMWRTHSSRCKTRSVADATAEVVVIIWRTHSSRCKRGPSQTPRRRPCHSRGPTAPPAEAARSRTRRYSRIPERVPAAAAASLPLKTGSRRGPRRRRQRPNPTRCAAGESPRSARATRRNAARRAAAARSWRAWLECLGRRWGAEASLARQTCRLAAREGHERSEGAWRRCKRR